MRWASFVAIALLGFGLRMWDLGARPMHTDEAVNAYIVGQLLAGESFHYDPVDRHGPVLAALAVPLAKAQGAHSFAELTETELRWTTAVAGTLTLLLFGLATEMFGFVPCLIAACLTAFAPLPVYYDRYFIHEPLLACASFAFLLSGWRVLRRSSVWWAGVAGASAALMLASKETGLLHLTAFAVAALVCCKSRGGAALQMPRGDAMLTAGVTFTFLTVALYTWWGNDWKSLAALTHALPHSIVRASGEGHRKPIWYYATLLASGWSGWLLCSLAGGGALLAIRWRESAAYRLLTVYLLVLAILYSLIPYKTPWLALNLWVPISLLAGLAINTIYRLALARIGARVAIPVCLGAALLCVLGIVHDTRQRVFLGPADEANPYAYAHTSEDLLNLPADIDLLARERGLASPRIAVIAADPWPLPWYLRRYSQTGYWQPGQDPGVADFYITSSEAAEQYKQQLHDRLHDLRPEFFGVRPGVLILVWSRDRE